MTLKEVALRIHLSLQLFSTLTIPRSGNKSMQPMTDTHTATPFVYKWWKKPPPKSPNQTPLPLLSPISKKIHHVNLASRESTSAPGEKSSRDSPPAEVGVDMSRKRRSGMVNASRRKSKGSKLSPKSARQTNLQPRRSWWCPLQFKWNSTRQTHQSTIILPI
jgi:hypothetical protein